MASTTLEISGMARPWGATHLRASGSEAQGERLSAGTRLGRYIVVAPLGRGGMGSVYIGRDCALGRLVALKVLHRRVGRRGHVAGLRAAREARLLARVSHPNVVEVFDAGRATEGAYVAMELVHGVTLEAWMRSGPRSRVQTLEVFGQAGRGLAAVHRAGLVHRDFKPANVIVGRDGRVRVLDLGLAHGVGERVRTGPAAWGQLDTTRLTTCGAVVGTPAYMAPEQHLGLAADGRADQYAFCLALYEAVTGQRPYRGRTCGELVEQKLAAAVDVPRRGLHRRLRRLLLRGLQPQPQRRFGSMDAVLTAMARA